MPNQMDVVTKPAGLRFSLLDDEVVSLRRRRGPGPYDLVSVPAGAPS